MRYGEFKTFKSFHGSGRLAMTGSIFRSILIPSTGSETKAVEQACREASRTVP